jgi:hypothetical protein
MRIRSTKPEFWRSERIASVSWDARLVLKGLESYVDDNGVGKDDIALIIGDLFQRDMIREPSRTVARVSEAISELHQSGLLWRYVASATALLFVAFWERVQRVDKPLKGRFPRPDGTMDYGESEIRESVANIREASRNLAPGTGEQGNRGTGEKEQSSDASLTDVSDPDGSNERLPAIPESTYPKAFEQWWTWYPRKDCKRKALEAWQRARKRAPDTLLVEAAKRYANDPNREDRYTKQPATWLNGDCWLSETLPARNGTAITGIGKPTEKALGYAAAAERIIAAMETP